MNIRDHPVLALSPSRRDSLDQAIRRISEWTRGTATCGAYTLWWALGMFALAVMLGLNVDGSGLIHARQHASLVADEAARAGGQQIIRPLGMRGIAAVSDPALAEAAAQAYLALYPDVHGVLIPAGPTTIAVVTTVIYKPKILGFIGVGPRTVTGRALITLNRTNNGVAGMP